VFPRLHRRLAQTRRQIALHDSQAEVYRQRLQLQAALAGLQSASAHLQREERLLAGVLGVTAAPAAKHGKTPKGKP